MGLDAFVFCDCVEKKRLEVPRPFPRLLFQANNGSPDIRSEEPAKIDKHDEWMELPPCHHEGMMAAGYHLGNSVAIERVRKALEIALRPPFPGCPVLMRKVIYSGTHSGDHLTLAQVRKLAVELQRLDNLNLEETEISSADSRITQSVVAKLRKLSEVSLKIKKPIAF